MSNKTTFQEKNIRLNKNNTDLTSILNTINNLPSSGSSGGSPKVTFFNCQLVESKEVDGVTWRRYEYYNYLGYELDSSKTYKFVILLNDGSTSVIDNFMFEPLDGGYLYTTPDKKIGIIFIPVNDEFPEVGIVKSSAIQLDMTIQSELNICYLVEL